ncbi:MAG: hypothetical protein OXE87_04320 [Chloroflexi bacterium]|nr:hypothetical protein [Chloroflexota bacterium]
MDTIAMDAYPFVAGAARAGDDVFTRHRIRRLAEGGQGRSSAASGFAASGGQANDGEKAVLRPSCARPFAARQLHLSRIFQPPGSHLKTRYRRPARERR